MKRIEKIAADINAGSQKSRSSPYLDEIHILAACDDLEPSNLLLRTFSSGRINV